MRINKKINDEIKKSTPDLTENIVRNVDWEQVKQKNAPKKPKMTFALKTAFATCCLVVLCLAIGLPLILAPSPTTGNQPISLAYEITIEVNPCIRLEVDKNDVVVNQYGLNQDGVVFLYKENFIGQNVQDATQAILNKFESHGFLNGHEIKVCVKDSNGKSYETKQTSLSTLIEGYLQDIGNGSIGIIDEDELERIEDEFDDKTLNDYEQDLIAKYTQKVLELATEKISAMNALATAIEPYAIEDDKTVIANLPCINQIFEFVQKYKYQPEFDLQRVRKNDLFEMYEDLIDEAEDLQEAIDEINEGRNENDFKELLDDIFDLAEDLLFEEDDD